MAETIQNVSLKKKPNAVISLTPSPWSHRRLPDMRDGLKPVQRRILYTMYNDLHLTFDGRSASAQDLRRRTGNYHPHGTITVYDALVRMAQPFMLRVPLVHGQGNFGSVDGDTPAADRYTEAKLTAVSERLCRSCVAGPRRCGPTTRTRRRADRCPRSSRTCWSTVRPASPSAWRPTSRRTTSAK